MFGFFKKQSPVVKLQQQYDKLTQEAYELSSKDRKMSDAKYAEANEIMQEIEQLMNQK